MIWWSARHPFCILLDQTAPDAGRLGRLPYLERPDVAMSETAVEVAALRDRIGVSSGLGGGRHRDRTRNPHSGVTKLARRRRLPLARHQEVEWREHLHQGDGSRRGALYRCGLCLRGGAARIRSRYRSQGHAGRCPSRASWSWRISTTAGGSVRWSGCSSLPSSMRSLPRGGCSRRERRCPGARGVFDEIEHFYAAATAAKAQLPSDAEWLVEELRFAAAAFRPRRHCRADPWRRQRVEHPDQRRRRGPPDRLGSRDHGRSAGGSRQLPGRSVRPGARGSRRLHSQHRSVR